MSPFHAHGEIRCVGSRLNALGLSPAARHGEKPGHFDHSSAKIVRRSSTRRPGPLRVS